MSERMPDELIPEIEWLLEQHEYPKVTYQLFAALKAERSALKAERAKVAELEAKLADIAGLVEKWRRENPAQGWADDKSDEAYDAGCGDGARLCATELQAVLDKAND